MQIFTSYIRVSTNRQGASGLGMEAQQEAVRRYIDSVGGSLVEEHIEIESGKCASRPVLARAIETCRRRKAKLVIAKLDRLSRSVAFTSTLMETDVDFVACDMPHANKLMLHMMAAFAEFEREQISSRTKAALAAARSRGVVLGSFGRVLADRQIADATEFAMKLALPIAEARRDGVRTLAAIAERLNLAGHLTREGGKFSPMTVARIVHRLENRDQNEKDLAA